MAVPTTTLETVTDYVSDARTLLQDTIVPYRYDDLSLLVAFNVTLLAARRLRADLFVYRYGTHVPHFLAVDNSEVHMEEQFRLPLVFGLASHALARDQEDVQDQRASTFMGVFETMLTGVRTTPIAGSNPPAGKDNSGGPPQ